MYKMVWPTTCCAIEALLIHRQDEEHPHARPLHEVAIDPSVIRKLTSGSYLISVGVVIVKNSSVRISISLDRGIVDTIDATAQMRRLSRSGFWLKRRKMKLKD